MRDDRRYNLTVVLASEYRLAWALLLNAAVLVSAWRLVRYRGAGNAAQSLTDVLLLWCGVQYLAVGLPGVLGVLNIGSITAVALALSVALWFGAGRANPRWAGIPTAKRNWTVAAPAIIAASFAASLIYTFAYAPILGDDALTYHAPAAVQWLHDGRINLFETWYFNPANTYSPLAGSIFVAWLMAPLHNDMLSRFVQVPALAMIFALMVQLCTALGAAPIIATLVAVAAALCRPFIGQAVYAMDDLWLAAFFLAVLVGLGKQRSTDALAPWRVGLALGLMLATKYTALLTLPVLVLMWDRSRWRPRQWAMCLGLAALIAGPWFIRNVLLTGNPVYPIDVSLAGRRIFTGMFSTHASADLRSLDRIRDVLAGPSRAFSVPVVVWATLALTWTAALAGCLRRLRTDPLVRTCLLGPVLGIGLFLWVSPYAEIRFIYPSLLLLIACAALALAIWVPWAWVAGLIAAYLAAQAMATSFGIRNLPALLPDAWKLAVIGSSIYLAWPALRGLDARAKFVAVLGGSVALGAFVYMHWRPYVQDYRTNVTRVWETLYGRPTAQAWIYAREWLLHPTDVLAYANTYRVYPLTGPRRPRPIVYVPTRAGVRHLCDLPHLSQPVDGDELVRTVTALMQEHTDAPAWLASLDEQQVRYLYVAKNADGPPPPEIVLARANPHRLTVLFETPAAVIYRLQGAK